MKQEEENSQAVYFKSLTIEGINCFKSEQTINLTDAEGNPAMWTVILGNNNTGKTTLLKCLASLKTDQNPKKGLNSPNSNNTFPSRNNKLAACLISTKLHNIEDEWGIHYPGLSGLNEKSFHTAPIFSFCSGTENQNINSFKIDAYGTQRKEGKGKFLGYKLEDRTESLFKDEVESIINAEEWFLGTDYNALKGGQKFSKSLEQIKSTLISILPDIKDIEINEDGERRVQFITNGDQKVLVDQLGSGYQSLVTWVVDLAKRMFDRYPESDNPLAEPAIVLVDEIDLHLHPEWQRKIVAFLRGKFPKTQFIVTAHSPLVVQSAEDINVVVLQKDEETDEVEIHQPKITNFQGWSIEEILSDLMGMGAKIRSDKYLQLIANFNEGLDDDNYQQTKAAFEELKLILNPRSAKLELLKLQMASLAND